MRKTERIQILGTKITCLFYADDGLILAKDKEKAERSIEIIREIGGKYGLQPWCTQLQSIISIPTFQIFTS